MKLSFYNIFAKKKNLRVGYNTVSNNFIVLTNKRYNQVLEFKDNLSKLEEQSPELYHALVENNFNWGIKLVPVKL